MKVCVVYPKNNKQARLLAEDLSKEAHSYPRYIEDYDFNENYDFLLIVYEQSLSDKSIQAFINQLSRQHIKNLSICYMFKLGNKKVNKIIKLCQEKDLPLMRELYLCKVPIICKPYLCEEILSNGRTYVDDMMTIIHNYY